MSFLDKHQNLLSKYNRVLIFLFVTLFFVENVTRYKHILFYMMIATALVYLIKDTKSVLNKLKNKNIYLVFSLSVFLYITVGYSEISSSSLNGLNNKLLNYGVLSLAVFIPILLYRETKENIAKLIIVSFSVALVTILVIELYDYYLSYKQGVLPFTTYKFRSVSDALVFFFPILPVLWYVLPKSKLIYFYILCVVFLFILLGTLARGGWVAVAVSGLIFIFFKRPWKLMLIAFSFFFIGLFVLKTVYPEISKTLFYKLEQTDSSHRYKNGVQGSAFELIMENPVIGYGYGDDVYIKIYNNAVKQHPNWVYRESLGPHNIWLSIWFGTGIVGLVLLSLLFLSMCYSSYKGMREHSTHSLIFFSFLTILSSLISFYLIRGMFEQVDLKPLGILLGFLIAMMGFNPIKGKGYDENA